ncbi:flippase [Candidatus Peregrinibacteria bacterium]|jgi:O-antigen/teichoic acid export membrane protein|nr:flippase [Candidatus Peregrinibacteria bacterium]MBT4055477.1 flippase [Candidatus Peregrinibacteria bacterium]
MSIARKILSNTLWQILGKAIVAILSVAVVKIVTNYLTIEGYGEYAIVYEFLAFFGIAADMGLFTIAVKEMSQDEKKIQKIIGNVLSLRTGLVITTVMVGVVAAFLIPKYQGTRIPIGITIATLTTIFTILNGTITSVLQTKLKMHIASIAQIIGKFAQVGYMLYIVLIAFPKAVGAEATDLGFYHLLVAGVIGNLVMLLITHSQVRKITPLKYEFDIKLWKEVLIKAVPFGLALILNTIYFRIDSILISLIQGQTQVGIYAVAMRVLEAFAIIPLFFMNSVLPVLTRALKENMEKARRIIMYSFNFLTAISVPMLVGAFILAYPIVFIVSSPEFLSRIEEGFYGSDVALQILMFALVFQFISTLFSFVLIAINKQSKILYINAVGVLLNITGNLIVIPIYGFIGAAVTSVVSQFFIFAVNAIVAYKYVRYNINITTTLKILLSAVLMGVAVKLLHPLSYQIAENAGVLLLVPAGALIYGALLLLTKAIDKDMLKLLRK